MQLYLHCSFYVAQLQDTLVLFWNIFNLRRSISLGSPVMFAKNTWLSSGGQHLCGWDVLPPHILKASWPDSCQLSRDEPKQDGNVGDTKLNSTLCETFIYLLVLLGSAACAWTITWEIMQIPKQSCIVDYTLHLHSELCNVSVATHALL